MRTNTAFFFLNQVQYPLEQGCSLGVLTRTAVCCIIKCRKIQPFGENQN